MVLEFPSPDDHIRLEIERSKNFYEFDLLSFLYLHGPQGGTFLDIGSHVGNHAVFFSKFLADFVVCVEPSDSTAALLERNLASNRVEKFSVLKVAVGAEESSGYLVEPASGNSGMARVSISGEEGSGSAIRVQSLDSLTDSMHQSIADEIKLVKIDIERLEVEALKGAPELLRRQKPDLLIEAPQTVRQVDALLEPFGYRRIGRFCITPTYYYLHAHRKLRNPGWRGRSWRWTELLRVRSRLLLAKLTK